MSNPEKNDPWRFTESIDDKQNYQDDLTDYNPFITNRAYSLHPDTLALADVLNRLGGIEPCQHYDFLFYAVPARKRYGKKWPKPAKEFTPEQIKAVQSAYSYNRRQALEALHILTAKQLKEILTRKG